MFSRHRRFYEITGKYFVCSDRWIWHRCRWDSTSPTNCTTYLTRSICLSNMKIFLKVVNTQQVYLESDIQHLPMPHFWDITSDHITFISLNDGSRESIALLYLLLWNALSLWILYVTAWLAHFENSKWISAPVQTMMTLCHPLVSISFWMSFNISPKEGAVIFLMAILNALCS